ncbi:hypothetical protein [Aestuariibacter salexigens]|uniref:hypothetical protein n=1 Tax=Aestuariibacter salexigens TaxID=226010 RepID=UPI00041F3BF1|nr:hypothetical protein [Aestuariibacter salexigens]
MDDNNQRLRALIAHTDETFRLLSEEPESSERHQAYEEAKQALEHYVSELRESLDRKLSGHH